MRLVIAEKPSLARAIADVLPGPHKRVGDTIECGGDTIVAWCAGHILEMAPPEEYSADYKSWRVEHLPIVPREWKLKVSTAGLLKSIQGALKKADRVVHAGDPDREGQLLVDEVLEFLGYRGPVDRVLINDLSPDAVRKALAELEPNNKYRSLYEAALARQRADWLYGLNLTRLYTLLGRQGNYDGVLSVGRVQTPLLGLIVRRDLEIESFTPVPYFTVESTIATAEGATFRAGWTPGSAVTDLDDDGRLLGREIAEDVRARTAGQPGTVRSRAEEKKTETPPLPFSLADLQVEAARRLGLSAKQVLDAAQSLYETHRLTTYPRSDCSYLPEGHHAEAPHVLAAIAANVPSLANAAHGGHALLRSKAWNDKKVTAHHAVIPTATTASAAKLSETERAVYELIARRYIAQFYPAFEYVQTRLELDISGERFTASGRRILAHGWRALFASAHDSEDENAEKGNEGAASLPEIAEGAAVVAKTVTVSEKKTQAPKPFNDATLMQAMCGIAKYVADPEVKKILSETDGIGTPATRASIIETLFGRGYIVRVKKAIQSTPTGRTFIRCLPESATTPDKTAVWEAAMRGIQDGRENIGDFLALIVRELDQVIAEGKARGALQIGEAHPCAKPGCTGTLRRIHGKNGFFWSCRVCRSTVDDASGKPKSAADAKKDQPRRRKK